MLVIMTKKEQLMFDVESALDHVRPHLAVDGGNVELVDVTDDGIVVIRWLGACSNCNMTRMTLKAGIEDVIKGKVTSIVGVRSIDEE